MSGTRSTGEGNVPAQTERLGTDDASLRRAGALIRSGMLVAFPTETVYGLGADGRNDAAVAALYAAKGRPSFNPLIAHVSNVRTARREGVFTREAAALAEAFWPGPLTLVVPVAETASVCLLARAGLDSVALRVPSHPVARALIEAADAPVVAPSANRSGRISPTFAAHVLADLDGLVAAVVDGGPTAIGVESTIVACLGDEPRLLRPGGVARAEIERVLGRALASGGAESGTAPVAPGALASHYAPRSRVRLGADRIEPGEAALLFGPELPGSDEAVARLNLSPGRHLSEAAANLFAFLHRLDESGATTIAVATIPEDGLGEAINDRLRRAAADR